MRKCPTPGCPGDIAYSAPGRRHITGCTYPLSNDGMGRLDFGHDCSGPPCPSCSPSRADLIEHELNEDCVCGPTAVPVKREDGSVGWYYTHHSLDGREANE